MYKVLICDDESFVIKSLIATVNWEENGFEVIGEAYDGLAAYDMIVKEKPHIVFTDIRMPGMNGLELVKKVNALNLNILFVAISGYAEFAYVQKAINCGVLGYCLKPFEDLEISNMLKKAKTIIDGNKSSLEIELLSISLDSSHEGMYRKFEILKALGFEWDDKTGNIILVLKGPEKPNFLQICNFIKLKLGNMKYAYLLSADSFNEIKNNLSDFLLNSDNVIGISKICYNVDKMDRAIQEACIAADQNFMTGLGGVYYFKDSRNKEFSELILCLKEAITKRDLAATLELFDFITQEFSKGVYNIKDAFKLYFVVIYSYQVIKVDENEYILNNYEQLISSFKNVREMTAYLRVILTEYVGITTEHASMDVKNETFRNIINYVNEHFFNDISIQSIAQKFTINPNYVSQLFKKEKGVTFTEYLTNMRVTYASNLLKTSDLSVNEVAEKSGFNDYFYFTRVFKKITSITPTAYRTINSIQDM